MIVQGFFKRRPHWLATLRELFGIDLRTLALFRVTLATVVGVDLINRWLEASTFYTDWGLLPREALIHLDSVWRVSLYLANGELWFSALLLAVSLLCTVALWWGYRTRLATLLLFVLLVSLYNRNPIMLIGGDGLVACLMFWSLFLPLGARWSIDAALSRTAPPDGPQHFSWASAGLLLQVLFVYFFTAWLKDGADWWPDGLAVYYTMEIERYASPLGRALLLPYPALMQALTYLVYAMEWTLPLLILSPWANRPLRFVAMLLLMAMHVGFFLFMEIGFFPFISLASLTILLGGWFWTWAERRPAHIKIYYDRDCGFCLKACYLLRHFLVLREADIQPAQDTQRARALMEAHFSWVVVDEKDVAHTKWRAMVALVEASPLLGWMAPLVRLGLWERPGTWAYNWVARNRGAFGTASAWLLPDRDVRFESGPGLQKVAGIFLLLVIIWNLAIVKVLPDRVIYVLEPLFRVLRIDQNWNMFAPNPSHLDGWLVFPGVLQDGTDVDVLRPGKPLIWAKPIPVSASNEDIRWHTYRWRLWDTGSAGHREYYGKFLCREWNAEAKADERLLTFEMTYVIEMSVPPGQTPSQERVVKWKHDCRPAELRRASGSGDPPAD